MAESQLQQEIRSARPFHSTSQEAMIGVLRTADLLRRHLEVAMGAADITPQQYNVLRILRGAGPDGLPTLTIGTRMVERDPGVTRLLDRWSGAAWSRGSARRPIAGRWSAPLPRRAAGCSPRSTPPCTRPTRAPSTC